MEFQPHWQDRERYVIFDTAFGDGAAFRATVDAWRADPLRPAHLHYIALAGAALPGFARILQPEPQVTLDLLHAPLAQALAQLDARIDAVALHGIEGEGVQFVRPLARLLRPAANLVAHALAPSQVEALRAAGFGPAGPTGGEAWHASFATRKPQRPTPPAPERRAVVLGAGLAGSAISERLCARGWQVTLVERHAQAAMEASGNRAGIYMPLLSKDDNIPTRLSRAAFMFALDYWEQLGGIGRAIEGGGCGVLQLARDAAHAASQRELAVLRRFPPTFAEWLGPEAAAALLGAPAEHGGWLFPQGGWARPASVCAAMLDACGARLERRFGSGSATIRHAEGEWQVFDAAGALAAQAPTLVLASGVGTAHLALAAGLPLSPVRGQVTHLAAPEAAGSGPVVCRESYVTPAAGGVRSVGATYDADLDPHLRMASQLENLERARALLSDPQMGLEAPLRGRVGFRSVAPDRLPLVGALPYRLAAGRTEQLRDVARQPGLYGVLGFASRGLTWAPLAAELLAARLEGEPLPLESALVAALDPARFLLRQRRGQSQQNDK